MRTTFTFLIFVLSALVADAQIYTGTISRGTPSPGSTITISFSLVPSSGSGVPNLVIYAYNSSSQTYSMLNTTSTFNGLAYYASYNVPAGTPNNTVLQFAVGTNTLPVTFYGTVASATVLPIIFKSFGAFIQGTDKALLKWELADNSHPLNKSIIYRSVDGMTFTAIDTIKGYTNQFSYTYIDLLNANSNSYFYRIGCVGVDGDKTISITLVITKNSVDNARILNNANVGNQLYLSGIDLGKYKLGDVYIADAIGRKLQATILNNSTLDVNYLKPGLYFFENRHEQAT